MTTKPSVLIVGGGTFGTSTAYHLAKYGYKHVTVLDRFDAPSKDSAACDLNKVVRADYPDPHYQKLGEEAIAAWKDSEGIFAGLYAETGWIMSTTHGMTAGWLESARQTAEKAGRTGLRYISVPEMKGKWPVLSGEFPGWDNLWSPAAGWVPSGKALLIMANAAKSLGVNYIVGDEGHAKKLLYSSDGTCIGVLTASGTVHTADQIVLATGANLATLTPLARTEISAMCSVIFVIQLETPEEIVKYSTIPIIANFEQGIIFPPDANGMIKLCSNRSLVNARSKQYPGASVTHSIADYPLDGCPTEIEGEIRVLLREMLPELADRLFVSSKMCWDGTAGDLHFRICPLPEANNLFVGTVGSLHGFKFMPVIGKYVADMLEGKLEKEFADLWAWKWGAVPEGHQHPHPGPIRDIADLKGWQGRNAQGGGKLPWTWSRV